MFNCRIRKEDGDKNIIKCKADPRLQPLQTVGAEQQSRAQSHSGNFQSFLSSTVLAGGCGWAGLGSLL